MTKSRLQVLRIAAAAGVDPRSVKAYLTVPAFKIGSPAQKKIAKVLIDLGLNHLIRGTAREVA